MKFIILVFLFGLLLRMLLKYIFPFIRIASVTHSRLKEMQEKMQDMEHKVNNNNSNNTRSKSRKDGDYIDYEEVG